MAKILLTGATGYIGKRLLPLLISKGYEVVCAVRDKNRFSPPASIRSLVTVIEVDLLKPTSLHKVPQDIDIAFYLVHSMASSKNYRQLEERSAVNFKETMERVNVKQVIYLSGIVNQEELSEHLKSRKTVEEVLANGSYAFTCLRAGIIIGSGSASFEIMRDLVEKLPVMIAPKWLLTRCQPISIADVLQFLSRSILNLNTYDQSFDIGGEEVMTYKTMLVTMAKVRKLRRWIWTVPLMTPRLSSYWLYFVTSTSYSLAVSLVDSMKVEVVCRNNQLKQILGITTIPYEEALFRAFDKIERNEILSSWKDAASSSSVEFNISHFVEVPSFGCFKEIRKAPIADKEECLKRIWSIGGNNGWYHGNWLWRIRGFLDKAFGGVGLRRGRTNETELLAGDALDFWRVIYANYDEGRLLLLAEMNLPGDAWLEFKMEGENLTQTATFRPKGVIGRMYWYMVMPLHGYIFNGLIKYLTI